LVSTEALEAEVEALQFKVETQEKRIAKLLKARDDLRDIDESIDETGGTSKKWYEENSMRLFLGFISGAGFTLFLVTVLHFMLGVV